MIRKRTIEKVINEELAVIVEKTQEKSANGEYLEAEFEKFFLLMRLANKLNLYSNVVWKKLKIEFEEALKKCEEGS